MPKVKSIEKKVWDVEGFSIAFKQNGKDVHGAKEGLPPYTFSNAAKNNMTVQEWKSGRFNAIYPGFEVAVYNGDNEEVAGNTVLGNLRDSYSEENS